MALHINGLKGEDIMKKMDLARKLTSRKLWVSVCSFVSLIVVATGGTESEAAQVASIIMAGATVIGYVVGEGLADAAGAADTEQGTKEDENMQ